MPKDKVLTEAEGLVEEELSGGRLKVNTKTRTRLEMDLSKARTRLEILGAKARTWLEILGAKARTRLEIGAIEIYPWLQIGLKSPDLAGKRHDAANPDLGGKAPKMTRTWLEIRPVSTYRQGVAGTFFQPRSANCLKNRTKCNILRNLHYYWCIYRL